MRQGFTLMELMLVLTLSAILAGSVVLSLHEPYQNARLENVLDRLTFVDRQMRDFAQRHARSGQIVFQLDAGTIAGVQMPGGDVVIPPFQATGGVTMDQVIVGGRRIECGEVAVAVSARGQTPTYAVRFRKPKGSSIWLVFLGATGQNLSIDNEQKMESLLQFSESQRTDAD